MLSAFYEVATGRAPDMLRAYLMAVLIQMVAVNLLSEMGYLHPIIPPFFGLATAAGGFLFGIGMFLSVGCAGAVLYRMGEGKLDYAFSLAGYAAGAWAGNNWLSQPPRDLLGVKSTPLTLHTALTVDRWLVIAILIVAGLLWALRGKRRPYFHGWDWLKTGTALGVVGVAAWAISAVVGRPTGLGTMQGVNNLAELLLEQDATALGWSLFLVAGIPLGSFLATRLGDHVRSKPFQFERALQAIAGGLCLGVGAAVAGGDNVLHGLSGVPLLAVASVTFMIFAFAGVWVSVRVETLTHFQVVVWPESSHIQE